MKIALIQSANLGFFPRFFADVVDKAREHNDEILAFLPKSGQNKKRLTNNQVLWGSRLNWYIHNKLYKLCGIQDVWSVFSTLDLICKLRRYNPHVINLHVVNECNLCFPLLVWYLNHYQVPVVWTFHDTRTITARCASFEEDQCFQWQTGCKRCTQNSIYSKSLINNVRLQWRLRKKWFNSINNLTIVTPSKWLAYHVKHSFLKNKPIVVLHNGIDTRGFSTGSNLIIPELVGVKEKIVLGVAATWSHRKGLDSMIWLSHHLPEGYKIVLVGSIPKELVCKIPPSVICIRNTCSKEELIAIYQKASVFVNPTLADNFPTVNIEALGAGIPVVTFDTGGSAESIDETCGIAVAKGDDQALIDAILTVCSNKTYYSRNNCIKRSESFSLSQFDEYIKLYHRLYNNTK